ncbi:MAG: hypothetical protein AAGH65_10375, partial [Pseudomonadota bacterium]
MNALQPQQFSPSAWCERKGRVVTTLLVATVQSDVLMILPSSLAKGVAEQLNRYTIGRSVNIDAPQDVHWQRRSDAPGASHAAVYRLSYDSSRLVHIAGVSTADAQSMPERDH